MRSVVADLSRLSEMMKRAAGEIKGDIDVLINNAGALFNTRQVTEDGLEKTFATNHMAYFVVTNLLLPQLNPGARIVSTASDAHKGARLDFDDLQSERRYSGFSVYGKSKLCNILFNRELARRVEGLGVTANCLHPGFVATRFGDQSGGIVQRLVKIAKPVGAISPEDGAKTISYPRDLARGRREQKRRLLLQEPSRCARPRKRRTTWMRSVCGTSRPSFPAWAAEPCPPKVMSQRRRAISSSLSICPPPACADGWCVSTRRRRTR